MLADVEMLTQCDSYIVRHRVPTNPCESSKSFRFLGKVDTERQGRYHGAREGHASAI